MGTAPGGRQKSEKTSMCACWEKAGVGVTQGMHFHCSWKNWEEEKVAAIAKATADVVIASSSCRGYRA